MYGILAIMVIQFMSGMATGFDLAFRLNYVLGILLIGSWVWSKAGADQITARVNRPSGPFSVGDSITEEIFVENRGRTPKAWVEVEDKTDIPGLTIRQVASLGIMVSFSKVRASGTLTRRGQYTLGPLVVRASDPFGLFPREVEFEGANSILVYPRIVPVPDFAAPTAHEVGDNSRRMRANILSTDVASVREYRDGDSIGRIHWLSTARTGRLMVKQFDRGSSSHVWVIFDQNAKSQAGEAPDSTDECGATIAASVIDRYGRALLPVGYSAHGSIPMVAPPDRSLHQRESIMQNIAASLPTGQTPLLNILADLERELSQSSSLVVITAAGDGDWVGALAGLQRRGVRISTVLMDRESFGGESNDPALQSLMQGGVRTFRVRHGESISDALTSPVGGAGRWAAHAAPKQAVPDTEPVL